MTTLNSEIKARFITTFADAAAKSRPLKCLAEESDTISKHFLASPFALQHAHIPHAKLSELIKAFAESRDRIGLFHFAGHANTDILEFEGTEVKSSGLAKFFSEQGCVPLVFLNGCNTDQHVKFFREAGVACVLGTTVPVFDETACAFSSIFYDQFIREKSTIRKAFEFAGYSIQADNKLGYNDSDFSIERGDITTDRDTMHAHSKTHKRNKWVLRVFDTKILDLKIDDIDEYIKEQIMVRKSIKPYAEWLISQHSRIGLSGLKHATEIDLKNIFVSLRGELSNSFEIFQSQKLLEENIKALEDYFAESNMSSVELQRQKSHLLGRSSSVAVLDERDYRDRQPGAQVHKELNLVEAFVNYDRLVILGDPGTGKTTTVQWLTLMLAHAWISKLKNEDYNISSKQFSAASEQFTPP